MITYQHLFNLLLAVTLHKLKNILESAFHTLPSAYSCIITPKFVYFPKKFWWFNSGIFHFLKK